MKNKSHEYSAVQCQVVSAPYNKPYTNGAKTAIKESKHRIADETAGFRSPLMIFLFKPSNDGSSSTFGSDMPESRKLCILNVKPFQCSNFVDENFCDT